MRFNKELLQVDEAEDQVILTTFQARLLSRDFFFSITKSPLRTVAELLHKAQKYMNTEDAVTVKGMTCKRKKDKGTSRKPDKKKEAWNIGHAAEKKKNLSNRRPKFTNFTPLVMPIDQVLMQIKDEPSLQWPKPIYAPIEVSDKNKYCRFHQDHRHHTNECKHLKDKVETLIRQGKLQKFVWKMEPYWRQQKDEKDREQETEGMKASIGEIRMISGGLVMKGSFNSLKKAYAREVNSIHSWFQSLKTLRSSELDIIFIKKDACSVKHPHEDLLVIMLRMEEFNIHRLLVDNGSSADIIYLPTFQQMMLSQERLQPFTSLLVSFTGDKMIPKGVIKLTVTAGIYPAQVSKEIDFLMVDYFDRPQTEWPLVIEIN